MARKAAQAAQADTAAATHDPSIGQIEPALANARTLLLDAGWRVKEPLKARTRTPAAPREYAASADIQAFIAAGVARLGNQQRLAESIGLRNIGPVAAGARGRPMTLGKLREFESAYAEHLGTNPPHPAVKSKAAPKAKVARKAATRKPRSAGTSPASTKGKRTSKAKATSKPRKPARNSGGESRAAKAPTREMGSGPVARMVAPGK